MPKCAAAHPDDTTVICTLPDHDVHAHHYAHPSGRTWPNAAFRQVSFADHRRVKEMATEAARVTSRAAGVGPPPSPTQIRAMIVPPNVRTDDPPSAHQAAELYEPKRDTARARVLEHLRCHLGEWIDAPDFTDPKIGGFAGTRRLRELRDLGWPIETRLRPGSTNTWQHRLIQDPPARPV